MVCAEPGCPVLVARGRCEAHAKELRRRQEAGRPSAAERGYGPEWRRISAEFLAAHPWCLDCGKPAAQSDHAPVDREELVRRGVPNPDAWEHLQPRCASCHSRRTNRRRAGG